MNDNIIELVQPQDSSLNKIQMPQNTSSETKKKGNILIMFGIVLMMSMIGVGAYFFGARPNQVQTSNSTQALPTNNVAQVTPATVITQTSQIVPTTSSPEGNANWKVYTNSKYGYSFEYPAEWANCPKDFGGGNTDSTIILCSGSVQPLDYIWTFYTPNPQNLDFEQLMTKDQTQGIKGSFKYTTTKYNKNIAYVTDSIPAGYPSREILFKTSSNAYVGISYQPNNSKEGFSETYSSYKILQQLLSSFKFQ